MSENHGMEVRDDEDIDEGAWSSFDQKCSTGMEGVLRHMENMKTVKRKASQSGFTLIEVIAVLVILAVLAAVAIPRYINLIDQARVRALEGAVAAGLSHTSLAYGRLALQTGLEPSAEDVAKLAGDDPPESAEYEFGFQEVGTTGVDVTATEKKDATMTITRLWAMP